MIGSTGKLIEAAQAYRANQHTPPGGVVLLWGGIAYGWKNALRDPGDERPGALAVDVDGHVFEAQGGNDYHGAQIWAPLYLR